MNAQHNDTQDEKTPDATPPPPLCPCGNGPSPVGPYRVSQLRLIAAAMIWTCGCVVTALVVPGIAEASSRLVAVASLDQVITNFRNVIVGLLVGLATLFATIGGVRLLLSGGDPGEAESAKRTLRGAAIGYGVAVLAPVLVTLLKTIVGA
ncbi:pilin [Spirillospora sp. NPDC048911]|uniref:pilin n=1 Tax=Spirillospora sp. NPDC048911 TaxID=3364527 RepID=UPI00371F9B88